VILDLLDNSLVLQRAAVLGEVDRLRLVGELLELAAGIVVALFESDKGVGCAAFEAELGADFAPIELEGRAPLWIGLLAGLFGYGAEVVWDVRGRQWAL
jgi:hypothetical protein